MCGSSVHSSCWEVLPWAVTISQTEHYNEMQHTALILTSTSHQDGEEGKREWTESVKHKKNMMMDLILQLSILLH